MNQKTTIILLLTLTLTNQVFAAATGAQDNTDDQPIISIDIDFQGIIDGIVNGVASILDKLIIELPGHLWKFFYDSLLLQPLGLDDASNDDDIISASGFFLSNQPDIRPFSGTIRKLSELLIVFLAFGMIFASVKAYWRVLTSDEALPMEAALKKDVLPLFIGAFALGLSVELYQLVLYIARLMITLFMANVDYLVFRDLSLFLISPDFIGLLGVALIFLFALFLLFTYVLELVGAFLLPIFITLRALPFDTTRAMGQAGLNFSIMNAFMPVFSAVMIFIATSVWASSAFWDGMGLDGFALTITKQVLGIVFLGLSLAIPVFFYFTSLIMPIFRYAIGFKLLKILEVYKA
ncbi:MAG TPA: hypothetical protein ENH13_01050 [Euryarchaeota archaeon]|nr:hypothetical protein [Euryarchaeota archaeon]